MQSRFRSESQAWVKKCKSPSQMLKAVEDQMSELNAKPPNLVSREEEDRLQREHERCLLMRESYWHQRSKIKWAVLGDRNSSFFHASTVTRRRRNHIGSLFVLGTGWATTEAEIRSTFVSHFKGIYTKGPTAQIGSIYSAALLESLPKIPTFIRPCLELIPSNLEIHKVAMSLGPHKAAGPDGFNAHLLQQYWDVFGALVCEEVSKFFITGVMPSSIAKSNLILIPKVKDPCQVGDYRPISVCNVIYKIISKILTTRLKPYIARCVSSSQSAFIPGREIFENVILIREVLHSFKSSSYSCPDFCLKVDLSKAFDRMDWDYLQSILPLYGVPSRMIAWIMACVRSSEFSIILNGASSGGSFKPSCGLRQGCSLSPYLFILGMDLLFRSLESMVNVGLIQGVRMAPSCQPITNILYADDLLLLGKAQLQEAHLVKQALQAFAAVSGQRIGPGKSSIWFSNITGETDRELIANCFEVKQDVISLSYLGAPIATTAQAFDFLIEVVSSRLNSWKSKLLSQAGRIILIKSVLQAILIYFMATTMIPANVIKKLNALIRKFFWGKVDKQRYMALLAWEKISAPIGLGGLGLRDLSIMNKAMLMKMLWRMVMGSEALWAQQLRAKYLPRSHLWSSKRGSRCTGFWRGLLALREHLQSMVAWQLGDGSICRIFAEPWFPQALSHTPQTQQDRLATVNSLVDEGTGLWKVDLIAGRFRYAAAMAIISNIRPPTQGRGTNRLIFSLSSNGLYSVKKAYASLYTKLSHQLSGGLGVNDQRLTRLWKHIWHAGQLPPRLRVFLWKLAHSAIPLGKVMSSRLRRGDPICQMCGQEEEDALHLAMLCSFSRSVWLGRRLAIRTDRFGPNIQRALIDLMEMVPEPLWEEVGLTLWAIWRSRNNLVFQGKQPSFEGFCSFITQVSTKMTVASSKGKPPISQAGGFSQNAPIELHPICCYSDGSWAFGWVGGAGITLFNQGNLIAYKTSRTIACCPLQAEAIALQQGVNHAIQSGVSECTFLTDCKALAEAIMEFNPPTDVDWRAHKEIFDIWKKVKCNKGFNCVHITREQNTLADELAKRGRIIGEDYMGFSFPMFQPLF